MRYRGKLFLGKAAVVAAAVPVALWAFEFGPPAGRSGVPGERGTCVGCHVGTENPATGGGIAVSFAGGTSYTPGRRQRMIVTITDPSANRRAWGFQLTARLSANTAAQAGAFRPTNGNTRLLCAAADLSTSQAAPGDQTCPGDLPLQYIEHSLTGYEASKAGAGSFAYEFDWTPPMDNAGDITLYAAGNAANGDLSTGGDQIYTRTVTLTPAGGSGGGGNRPTIADNGVRHAASGRPGIVAGSFASIYGTNLAPGVADWANAVIDGKLPASLNGVSVTIGGKPAFLSYVSPSQINLIVPEAPAGITEVRVATPAGQSEPFSGDIVNYAPAFFAWPQDYVVATHADFSLAAKPGLFPGATSVPARPGEIVILWGSGFGPTDPPAPEGSVPPPVAPKVVLPPGTPLIVLVDGAPAELIYAVLSQYAGLYQIAIRIPETTRDGDVPVRATIGIAMSPEWMKLTVQR